MAGSSRTKFLSAVECRMKAEECRRLALKAETQELQIMIERIVELWLNIARAVEQKR